MKSLITSILFFSILPVWSQNLVPNGNFENPFLPHDQQWRQPHGDYYHYYQDPYKSGEAYEGQFYNGICIYNHQENEFMQTSFSEPLIAGRSYCVKTMARLLDVKAINHEMHDKIGLLFTSYPFQVDIPVFLDDETETFWLISDTINRFEWFDLNATYTANGTEKYLTIGYFRSLGWSEKYKSDSFEAMIYAPDESEDKKPIPPPNFESNGGKMTKKQEKEMAKFRNDMMAQNQKKAAENPQKGQSKLPFTLRYYLDDICLALMQLDGTCDCAPELSPVDLSVGATVRMDNLLFESGKSVLLPESEYALEVLAGIMKANPNKEIAIHGHTDNVGSDADNLILSQERAMAVYDYLISVEVEPERLRYQGFGSSQPTADNSSKEGRAQNRRVEFVILKQ